MMDTKKYTVVLVSSHFDGRQSLTAKGYANTYDESPRRCLCFFDEEDGALT